MWGVAYHVEDSVWEGGVRDQLDHREKGGYTQHPATFFPLHEADMEPVTVTLYLGDTDHRLCCKTIHRFHNRLYNHGEGPY